MRQLWGTDEAPETKLAAARLMLSRAGTLEAPKEVIDALCHWIQDLESKGERWEDRQARIELEYDRAFRAREKRARDRRKK